MKMKIILTSLCILFILEYPIFPKSTKSFKNPLEFVSKPYARYWWFASIITEVDVRYNLNWLKENGFGGVEVAWVYPLNRFNKNDTSYTPRQEWLSKDWQKIVEFTIKYADSIGLGCDLTFGTLWPFGDTYVTFDQATQKYGDVKWRQEITRSWQHPKPGYVIDHLTPKNYEPYFNRLLNAFPRPKTKINQSYFIDSWEVETEKLWTENFDLDFQEKYGYDIKPYMDNIYDTKYKNQLYDYMSLISDKVLEFYKNYDLRLNEKGILSRGQVSGAPCDLISGYSLLDIPEGESMLFEPEFCSIPASAALLSGKKIVSSETFTCLYGWPRDYIREEQTADLKLVADALFANGINHIIWHGKAHNPNNVDSVNFYATCHLGKNGKLSNELTEFNKYLEKVSFYMKKGESYSDIAVYLPTEDSWINGVMPKNKQFIWAWGYYEMRYVYFPDELKGYNPIWINGEFLEKAKVVNKKLIIGGLKANALYINSSYLDIKVIKELIRLANMGLKIFIKSRPQNPSAVKNENYAMLVDELMTMPTIANQFDKLKPFIEGNDIPIHWVRKDGNTLYVFFPNPKANRLKFPLDYGYALTKEKVEKNIKINYEKYSYNLNLSFNPYQSLLFKLKSGKVEQIDIEFIPETPIVKNRPNDYVAPWLVK